MKYAAKRIEIRIGDEINPCFVDVEGTPETQEEWLQYRGTTMQTCTLAECHERGVAVPDALSAFGPVALAAALKRAKAAEAGKATVKAEFDAYKQQVALIELED